MGLFAYLDVKVSQFVGLSPMVHLFVFHQKNFVLGENYLVIFDNTFDIKLILPQNLNVQKV